MELSKFPPPHRGSSSRSMRLLTVSHPEDPVFDMALSHALLRRVAEGDEEPLARVYVPGPTAAFGRLDALSDRWPQARTAALAHDLQPVVRLGGGRAAVYDAGSVVVEIAARHEHIAEGLQERFAAGTRVLAEALRATGVPIGIGELPGEYCPGRWSIHVAGGPKIAGAAQRSIRGAALFSAFVIVQGGARVRAALTDLYAALGLAWDPMTAGAAEDAVPGLTAAAVAEAIARALGPVTIATPSADALARAAALTERHAA